MNLVWAGVDGIDSKQIPNDCVGPIICESFIPSISETELPKDCTEKGYFHIYSSSGKYIGVKDCVTTTIIKYISNCKCSNNVKFTVKEAEIK